jgi:hypothetical protein
VLAVGAGLVTLVLGVMTLAFWLGLGAPVSPPPSFERVRASWKPSEISLLDRTAR